MQQTETVETRFGIINEKHSHQTGIGSKYIQKRL